MSRAEGQRFTMSGRYRALLQKDTLAGLALTLAALLICGYQSGLVPYFEPMLGRIRTIFPLAYFGSGLLVVLTTAAIVATDSEVRRVVQPVLVAAAVVLAYCLVHPLDLETLDLVRAGLLLGCLPVLCIAGGPTTVLRLSASITALQAVLCLLDIAFADGFTNTTGRAGGLGINPNISAAVLVLGAVATHRAVSDRWRAPFLLLVGTALFCTLSRSAMLIASVALVVAATEYLRRQGQAQRTTDRRNVAVNAVALLIAVGVMVSIAAVNERFVQAARVSFAGAFAAQDEFAAANESITHRLIETTGSIVSLSAAAAPSTEGSSHDQSGNSMAAKVLVLGQLATDQGKINSAAARALMFERSIVVFAEKPLLGNGLDIAFNLAPHNTYLMFAVAFGLPGLLVPLAFLFPAFYRAHSLSDLGLGVAFAGLMLFSHNILLVPHLLIPYLVGVGGLIAARCPRADPPAAGRIVPAVALFTFLALVISSLAIAATAAGRQSIPLSPATLVSQGGYAFSVAIFPPFAGLMRVSEKGTFDMHEDDATISATPSTADEIRRLGAGHAMRSSRDILIFSSSDNSDPRSNGRAYTITVPVTVHPLLFLMIGATLFWCFGVSWAMGSTRRRI